VTSYSCNPGDTLSGTTCTYSYPPSYMNPAYYDCPNGGTLSGTTCSYGSQSFNEEYCPHANDTFLTNPSRCKHDRTANYGTQTKCEAAGYNWNTNQQKCFEFHSVSIRTTYSCASGWTLNGYFCTQPARYNPATGPYCPGGERFDGSGNCAGAYNATPNYSYSCPSGGTLSGTKCVSSYAASSTSPYYTCDSGGTLSGSTCTKTTTSTYAASSTAAYSDCPSGGTLSGSTCTKTYTATQSGGYYYCADGGTMSGTTCKYSYTI
jgi:conjugal transfer mating pair stabilization protein TraN